MAACLLCVIFLAAIILLLLLFTTSSHPQVTLASFTTTSLNFTGDHISGDLNLQFQVLNPNCKTDFSYKDVYCTVYRGENRLASTVFPDFFQANGETTPINVTVHLKPGTSAKGIGNDLATYCFTEFNVQLTALIKWRPGISEFIKFSCDDVAIGLLPAAGGHGKMIGPARMCQ